MEIRDFAERILQSAPIADKLAPIAIPVTDVSPGSPLRVTRPARLPELQFAGRKEAPPMPRAKAFRDPHKRGIAHHIMANHELLALEVMAFALCAFPDAPGPFRHGMIAVMADEQRHTRMHIRRAAALGVRFGDFRVNGYFWEKAQAFQSILDYVAGLSLTFEGGNLDHTLEFAESFAAAGDARSAALMRIIHRDEIEHVKFGVEWLRLLKHPSETDWEAYARHLHWPLRPQKSKGKSFHRAPREAAGMTPEFIAHLEDLDPS
jgi:uncharacterized ferritin-like protein (DUF455 family)